METGFASHAAIAFISRFGGGLASFGVPRDSPPSERLFIGAPMSNPGNINLVYDEKFGDNAGLMWIHEREAFRTIAEIHNADTQRFLADMPYNQFLRSIYWQVIRKYLLHFRGRECAECGRGGMIHIHHESYDNHGNEHAHLEDLTILCASCHELLRHTNEHILELLRELIDRKKWQFKPWQPVMVNDNYDPRKWPKMPIPGGGILE